MEYESEFKFVLESKFYEPNTGVARLNFMLNNRCHLDKNAYMVHIGKAKLLVKHFLPEIETNEMYMIVSGFINFGKQSALVAKCLIDNDYEEDACFYLPKVMNIDFSTETINVPSLVFDIYTPPNLPSENIYNYQLFDQYNEDLGTTDKIDYLMLGTENANGIDIVFKKSYNIEPHGILELNLEWSANQDFKDKSNLILLRSSLARKGVSVSIDRRRIIMLINNSDERVYLGTRFLQIVPSALIQFGEARKRLNYLNVGLYNGLEKIKTKSTKARTSKFEKETEGFTFAKANFF